jgi:hypothetical protein
MILYSWLKFIHVFLAIGAVGFNASYGVWLSRSVRDPEHELNVLKGIKVSMIASPTRPTRCWLVTRSPCSSLRAASRLSTGNWRGGERS